MTVIISLKTKSSRIVIDEVVETFFNKEKCYCVKTVNKTHFIPLKNIELIEENKNI